MNEIADHGVRFGRIAAMLPVADILRALDFYVAAMGFTKIAFNVAAKSQGVALQHSSSSRG